jgi:flagella basal body P-ring formation protein FlgA
MKALVLAAALCALAAPALAGTPVALRPDTASATNVVTLGDLFDGAGAAAATPIATRTGASVILNARAVQLAAARAGLDWNNAEGFRTIVVHGDGAGPAAAPSPAAAARGNVEVLAWARSLQAGEIVQPQDLVWTKAAAAPGQAPSDADAVIGLAARRPLREGAAVSLRDVAAVPVIKAGDTVTVTYAVDGVALALDGKAMSGGAVGDTLNVQNTASKKIIQAVIEGPGRAVVGPAAQDLKSTAAASRYALR